MTILSERQIVSTGSIFPVNPVTGFAYPYKALNKSGEPRYFIKRPIIGISGDWEEAPTNLQE